MDVSSPIAPRTIALPPVLAAHVPRAARLDVLDYYQGPFQAFEDAATRDMDWDVAASLAILPARVGDLLELGAGSGRLTAPLASVARTLTAIERSPAAAERLRERFGGDQMVRVVETALEDHAPPPMVDTVALLGLSVHVLPWSTVRAAFALAAGCLRAGGSLCVNVMADGAVERMAAMGGEVRRRRYRDEDGVEREMLTTTRFNHRSRALDQYWLIADELVTWTAHMRSHFWRLDVVTDALALAGFHVRERIAAPIGGGAGEGCEVIFLRADMVQQRGIAAE